MYYALVGNVCACNSTHTYTYIVHPLSVGEGDWREFKQCQSQFIHKLYTCIYLKCSRPGQTMSDHVRQVVTPTYHNTPVHYTWLRAGGPMQWYESHITDTWIAIWSTVGHSVQWLMSQQTNESYYAMLEQTTLYVNTFGTRVLIPICLWSCMKRALQRDT